MAIWQKETQWREETCAGGLGLRNDSRGCNDWEMNASTSGEAKEPLSICLFSGEANKVVELFMGRCQSHQGAACWVGDFYHCCNKIPDKKAAQGRGLFLAHGLKEYSPSWQWVLSGGSRRQLVALPLQSRSRETYMLSVFFLLCIQSGMALPCGGFS